MSLETTAVPSDGVKNLEQDLFFDPDVGEEKCNGVCNSDRRKQCEMRNNNNGAETPDRSVSDGTLPKGSTISDEGKSTMYVGKNYAKQSEDITIYLLLKCGVRLEFYNVPRRYYASEITVLVVRDTGLKHDHFKLLYNKEPVKPLKPLEELADETGLVQLEMQLRNLSENSKKIRLGKREVNFKSGLKIPVICRKMFVSEEPCSREDILSIYRDDGNEEKTKDVCITWLPSTHHKLFLGGYRHKIKDTVYHHAYSQTLPRPRSPPEIPMFSRDTQTYKVKHFGQTTVNHMSTQFSKPGFFVSSAKDQLRTPGPYETADEYLARVLRDVIIIQKYTRRWLAKRRVDELRRLRDAYLEWERKHAQAMEDQKAKEIKFDFERRCHPKTQGDFDRLFNALQQWKVEQVERITATAATPAEKKAALALLLDQEAGLIAAIGQHQLCASRKGKERAQMNALRKAAAPIRWLSSINGRGLEMETQQTKRAKELLDMCTSLSMRCVNPEERLDILLTIKRTVRQYPYKICQELLQLIEREAELILRGVHSEQLRGLRQRINNQFVKFAKIPQVNPEISKYITVPTGTREEVAHELKGDVHYCISCDRYLRNTAFPLSARANRLTPCKECRRLDNRARKRLDLGPYERILSELRRKELELTEEARERAREDMKEMELRLLEQGEAPKREIATTGGANFNVLNVNPFTFLVNEEDIRFLVDDVWERRSILSGWLDITDLVITRWRLNEPWSPWNMLVVTRKEAEAHEKLGNFPLNLAYADAMMNKVNQRLITGRNAFQRLKQNGIRMAYEQAIRSANQKNPQQTQEWVREKRQRLPPLAPHHTLLEPAEERHRPRYQPPDQMLPVIRGEKLMREVQAAGN
ncbi:unnamed protein product [Dicrocoelium dendriticum]|nr:unnamed protein product [Dicrocoelium dendriticum]